MRTTKQLSITLPTEMAEAVKEQVASGSYASESEVIRDGLRTLFARDAVLEAWLRTEVVAAAQPLPLTHRVRCQRTTFVQSYARTLLAASWPRSSDDLSHFVHPRSPTATRCH